MTNSQVPSRDPEGQTSSGLLQGLRVQDPTAWRKLVQLYTPLVCFWCRRDGLHAADLADLVQEVFQTVARIIRGFREDKPGDSFRGWLRIITRNKVRDWNLARGKERTDMDWTNVASQSPPFIGEEVEGTGPGEGIEKRIILHRAVELVRKTVETRSWQVFWQVTIECRRPADVAQELGLSENAVYLDKSRILRRLKEEIDSLDEDGFL